MIGRPGPDTIVGIDDDDTIFGLGGNDRIINGPGSDKIFAGIGNDTTELEGTRTGAATMQLVRIYLMVKEAETILLAVVKLVSDYTNHESCTGQRYSAEQ